MNRVCLIENKVGDLERESERQRERAKSKLRVKEMAHGKQRTRITDQCYTTHFS